MSLFVTGLAFTDPDLASEAKLGILVASLVSGVAGWAVLGGLDILRSSVRLPGLGRSGYPGT
ncbi:MAG: Na+/H+ antiporter NhaA [Chloroflexi bacterium]|nr:Na+/H+ antiporter NhaA [Chloroflexota bacterium]